VAPPSNIVTSRGPLPRDDSRASVRENLADQRAGKILLEESVQLKRDKNIS